MILFGVANVFDKSDAFGDKNELKINPTANRLGVDLEKVIVVMPLIIHIYCILIVVIVGLYQK